MKNIDWNKMAELGLIKRINIEILHPLGLALSRNPETGFSEKLLFSEDGTWSYSPDMESPAISAEEIRKRINS